MKNRTLIIAALCVLPGALWAEKGDLPVRTSGWYLGAGLGYTQMEAGYGPVFIDGSDFGYKIYGGYRLPRAFLPWGANIAIDLTYADLGEVSEQALGSDFTMAISGIDVSLVGILPITRRWELFGKVGAFASDTTIKASGAVQDEASSTDLSLGFGLAFQTGSPWALSLELDSFNVVEGAWLASFAGTYQFK